MHNHVLISFLDACIGYLLALLDSDIFNELMLPKCSLLLYLLKLFILQYGKDYEYDAPVKLLDKHLHAMAQSHDEQLVVVSQVYNFFLYYLYSLAESSSLLCNLYIYTLLALIAWFLNPVVQIVM